MVEEYDVYEQSKTAIRGRHSMVERRQTEIEEYDDDHLLRQRHIGVVDVLSVGTKIIVGSGVGLLAGIATIALVASAGEIILAGVITKIAGVVGGAMGLSIGVSELRRNSEGY
ncbi:Magnetosome protein Mad8 [Desulfovibrionales bacterium]